MNIELLMAELAAGIPALPGAACKGRGELFDPIERTEHGDDARYRHQAALRLCASCPSTTRARCEEWLESLPIGQRPPGIVAGRLVTRREYPATVAV